MKTTRKNLCLRACLLLVPLLLAGCGEKSKIQTHMENGENYYKDGKFEEAKIEYRNLARRDPKNPVAHARLGEIWLRQGSAYLAGPPLVEALRLDPNNERVGALLAEANMAMGNKIEARKHAVAVLEKNPAQEECLLLLAESAMDEELIANTREQLKKYAESKDSPGVKLAEAVLDFRKKDLEGAERKIRMVLAGDGDNSRAHLMLANVLQGQGRADEALEAHRMAAELAPPRAMAKLSYAQFLFQSRKLEKAKGYLESLTDATPDYLPAWILRAEIALQADDYAKADEYLERVFHIDQLQPQARLLQARLQMAKGENAKALANLRDLGDYFDGLPRHEFLLAEAYLRNGNVEEGAKALERFLEEEPNHIPARLLQARLDIRAKNFARAISTLEVIRNAAEEFLPAQDLLADAYIATGRLEDAAALMRARIEKSPKEFAPHFLLGKILRQQDKAAEAAVEFELAHELDPENPLAVYELADLDAVAGVPERGVERLQECLAKNPESAPAHYNLGRLYAHQKLWAEAEAAFQKTIEIESRFMPAYEKLVGIYQVTNQLDEARKKLRDVTAMQPGSAVAWLNLAMLEERAEEYAKAEEAYLKVMSLDPEMPLAPNNLAYIYATKMGRLDDAEQAARKARLVNSEDPGIADTLGWILYLKGNYGESLTLIREASRELTDNPEVSYHLGMASYMMGDPERARAALSKAARAESEFDGQDVAREYLAKLESFGPGTSPAIGELEEAVEAAPGDPMLALSLARAREAAGDHEGAREAYDAVVAINPNHLDATLGLASLYAGPLKELPKAGELARKARELAPDDGRVLALQGRIALSNREFPAAYSFLSLASNASRADAALRKDSGMAAYFVGRIAEARERVGQALSADLNANPEAEARLFLQMTDPENPPAQTVVEATLQGDPDYLPALFLQAQAAKNGGDLAKSSEVLTKVHSRFPQFFPAEIELAEVYISQGVNDKEAKNFALAAKNEDREVARANRVLGISNYRLKQYAEAAKSLAELEKSGTLDPEALFYFGAALVKAGQAEEGKPKLEEALGGEGLPPALQEEARELLK